MQFSFSSSPKLDIARLSSALGDRNRRRITQFAAQVLTPLAVAALTILAYKFWA
ncbi:MAG: hypothetical protein AB7M12_02865 [Hyphomonadaceae bacterium]